MTEYRSLLERAGSNAPPPDLQLDGVLRRRDRKRRNQRIAAGVVGIAVFVAAIWIVTTGGSFNRTQQPAIQPTPTPEPSLTAPETAYVIDLNTGEMTPLPKSIAGNFGYAVSPDGTMVAYISQGDRGAGQVFIASLDGTDVQQVTHDRRRARSPDWSPEGEAIAYTSWDGDLGNIFVLDLATGETSQVTNEKPTTKLNMSGGPGRGADAPQFSPNGASIVYEVNRGQGEGIRIVPVTGGKSVLLVGGGKNDVGAANGAFSPDGSTLAATCWGPEFADGICIAHADGTNLRTLVSALGAFGPKWSPDGMRIAYFNAEQGDVYPEYKIYVVDVATGETTFLAEGAAYEWLDDHALIVEHVKPG